MRLIQRKLKVATSGLAFAAAACALPASSLRSADGLAVVGVNVVDVMNGATLPNRTVLVRDGRVAAMGPSTEINIPGGFKRVNGSGKTLIPGLWDMHVHLFEAGDCTLPIMASYGVTGVRDMGGDRNTVLGFRQAIRAGRLVGPELLVSSPPFESQKWLNWVAEINKKPWQEVIGERTPVSDEQAGTEEVRRAKLAGFDLVKIRNLDPGSYRAVLAEAAKQQIPVAGHATAGKAMIDDVFNPSTADSIGAAGKEMASIEHIESISGQLGERDADKRRTFFEAMHRHGTMLTPTLVTHRFFIAAYTNRAWLKQQIEDGTFNPDASPQLRQKTWQGLYDMFPADPKFDMTKYIMRAEQDAKTAHAAGVEMIVGTDLAVPLVIPGRSVHDEMEAMVKILPMKPAEALKAATYNAAKAARLEKDVGQIAPGYRASFLLLDANPLQDISATRRISGLVLRGQYFDGKALADIRARARATMKAGGQCTVR